jgi:exoribonuclease II
MFKKKKKQIIVKLIIAKNHKSQLFLKKVIKAGIKKTEKSFNLANADASTDKHYIDSYENAVEGLVKKCSKATLEGFCKSNEKGIPIFRKKKDIAEGIYKRFGDNCILFHLGNIYLI